MDKILIHGGRPLSGSIKVSGSKNSSLPILAATLLTPEPCVVQGVPDLSDTHYMLQILTHLGAQVERASGTVTVAAEKIQSAAPYDVVRKMRASVCVLGPLLGRCKEATVSLPGGCVIGDRPIDLHLTGFEALGAAVRVEGGDVKVFAPKLIGAVTNLRGKFGPTVLGTDNVMMSAVLADGVTVIEGAAQEPEVVDLANFLNKMGAKIEGAGTRRIIIEGVAALHGAEHTVIPDRIEAGTFLVAGAICGKEVTVKRVEPEHVRSITDALVRCGFPINIADHSISISPNGEAKALELITEPYPGFPTDMQAQMRDGEYFSATLHARRGAKTHGSANADGRRNCGDPWGRSSLWRAGYGERSARVRRPGACGIEGGRNYRGESRVSHRSGLRAAG